MCATWKDSTMAKKLDWMMHTMVPLEPGETDETIRAFLERMKSLHCGYKDLSRRDQVKLDAVLNEWLRDNDPNYHINGGLIP
jgi:hypothetical protein